MGLHRGMPFADARAFCPDLLSAPAHPARDARFLSTLRRWATRYCPWVGLEGEDGLVLDITGSAHLFGGEAAMLDDMRARLDRAGLAARLGLAPTRGAAWALARHGGAREQAGTGENPDTLGRLPVAALRLEPDTVTALERLGLRTIADLAATPRAPLTRRFGPGVLLRLDQALETRPEQIAPETEPPHYGVRLTLPEPIGLVDDVMAGTARLVERLCARLKENAAGARALCLTLRRVDQACQQAAAMPLALAVGGDAEVQQMRLAAGCGEDAVANQLAVFGLQQPHFVAGLETVAQHAQGPGKGIGPHFQRVDAGHIVDLSGPQARQHGGVSLPRGEPAGPDRVRA